MPSSFNILLLVYLKPYFSQTYFSSRVLMEGPFVPTLDARRDPLGKRALKNKGISWLLINRGPKG